MARHECYQPGYTWGLDGPAFTRCLEDSRGRFWCDNDRYATQVNYCPICGMKAPHPVTESEDCRSGGHRFVETVEWSRGWRRAPRG